MDVDYITQPDTQLGILLSTMLDSETPASKIMFVSAFVGLQTIMRLKSQVADLRASGTDIRFILGIDLNGTSQEVLKELLDWNLDVRIVKHRIPGHTFHPKLYLFEWSHQAFHHSRFEQSHRGWVLQELRKEHSESLIDYLPT